MALIGILAVIAVGAGALLTIICLCGLGLILDWPLPISIIWIVFVMYISLLIGNVVSKMFKKYNV